ncbi:hypothetical protein AX16_008636 [Volvariella volvacea WC 439]|nr:hypothetical protein AX16_008636 [Volvariella volvacea WC 439]
MAPGDHAQILSLDTIVHQITTSNSPLALNHTLKSNLPRDTRDTILASLLPGNTDPLTLLDPVLNSLGYLWILSARLTLPTSPPPSWQTITTFCESFVPEHARLAPERVTLLAKGISRLASQGDAPSLAIQPLYHLVTRYPYHPTYLTTIHPLFVLHCVISQRYTSTLPILSIPITSIDTNLSDLTYNDNLLYHYLGGIALAALKKWTEAEEFFEICMSSPGTVASALQLEAFKKLKLIQLISRGESLPVPRYTHGQLSRLFKASPYSAFVDAYPHNTERLQTIYEKEKALFAGEKNLGLINQALGRAPRWAVKRLTATYLSLSLSDIGKAVKIESEDAVRELILSMIEDKDISAKLSADGSVTFFDPPPQFTKEQVDLVLRQVQEQAAGLNALELEVGRSKEFLVKALKNREDGGFGNVAAQEEELYGLLGPGVQVNWNEEPQALQF